MEHDYAGSQDIRVNSRPYFQSIQHASKEFNFQFLVEAYLRSFHDGHLSVTDKNRVSSLGFDCRRCSNGLFVTSIKNETRLQLGDEVIAIDDHKIGELARKYQKQLDPVVERQNWNFIFKRAKKIKIKTTTKIQEIELKKYINHYHPEHSFKNLSETIGYMKLTDFFDPDDIERLISKSTRCLNNLNYLIIDVRVNHGGDDQSYRPLLEYFVNQSTDLLKHYPKDYFYEIWWTKRNKVNWLANLSSQKSKNPSNYMKELYEEQTKIWKNAQTAKNASENNSKPYILKPKGHLKHIYILSDYLAGSAADNFIMLAKTFAKTTVVGRNTADVVDYGDVTSQCYSDFTVNYPVIRLRLINDHRGTNGIGFSPDVYLPWTPKMIFEDTDLKYILNLIQQYSKN